MEGKKASGFAGKTLTQDFASDDVKKRWRALRRLESIISDEAFGLLKEQARYNKDWHIRLEALKIIKNKNISGFKDLLTDMLQDPIPELRAEAGKLLQQLNQQSYG